MQVKDKFYSYEDLKDAVKRYGDESLQCFVKRDSCTIETWIKKQKNPFEIDPKIKSEILYQKVIFKCIYHNKDTESKGQAVRLECGYNGKNCKAAINVSNVF